MKIIILGNGIAGITAARHIRKLSDHDITVVSDESDHFFSRTALMYVFMGHMRFRDIKPYEDWFWEKNRIALIRARVERIDFQEKKLFTTKGETVGYDKLLIATGSKSNKFGWPGQDLDGVHGLYHLQDLEAMECHSAAMGNAQPTTSNQKPITKRAVIVGGGLIGVEMAEMFHSRGIPVTFLVRESDFWNVVLPPEESRMVTRHLREHHIDLRLETELKEILAAPPSPPEGGEKGAPPAPFRKSEEATPSPPPGGLGGAVGAVVTNKGETIPCGFVGLTVGVSPNIDFLKGTALETNRGILVNEFLETNIRDVYAAGDCAEIRQPQPGRKPIEAVWYTGRMMGETVAHNMVAHPDEQNRLPASVETSAGKPSTRLRRNSGGQAVYPPPSKLRRASRLPSTVYRLPYNPGTWFNSAKFFDIEYQVYGDIQPQLPDNQATLYWEHPDGKKSIRINYEVVRPAVGKPLAGKVVGFNLMGVRYRHEVCKKWIAAEAHIEEVLQRLGMANFDPEFSSEHEAELVNIYNGQTGKNLKLKQKRGLEAVLAFLK